MRRTNGPRPAAAVLASGALLTAGALLVGCTDDASAPTDPATAGSPAAPAPADPTSTASPDSGAGDASASARTRDALAAIGTAEKAVSGGTVFDLESDTENGERIWEVKVADPDGNQFDLDISHDGHRVIRTEQDRTPDDDVAKVKKATVSLQKAIGIADARVDGDAPLTEAEIDADRGRLVWQIEFGGDDGTTALVDARSGDVVRVGRDAG